MRNVKRAMEWLRRAKSNLACAKTGRVFQDILYEDLCFNAQQAVEKALKSLCIIHEIVFSRTHDISYLIELLEKGNIHIPDEVQQSKLLTDYAVEARYPGGYEPVDEEEYETAVEIAEITVNWIEGRINGEK